MSINANSQKNMDFFEVLIVCIFISCLKEDCRFLPKKGAFQYSRTSESVVCLCISQVISTSSKGIFTRCHIHNIYQRAKNDRNITLHQMYVRLNQPCLYIGDTTKNYGTLTLYGESTRYALPETSMFSSNSMLFSHETL